MEAPNRVQADLLWSRSMTPSTTMCNVVPPTCQRKLSTQRNAPSSPSPISRATRLARACLPASSSSLSVPPRPRFPTRRFAAPLGRFLLFEACPLPGGQTLPLLPPAADDRLLRGAFPPPPRLPATATTGALKLFFFPFAFS